MSEEIQEQAKRFVAIRFEWPVDSISNSLFSIRKGEIILAPEGVSLDPKIYEVFGSYEDALKFVRMQPVEVRSNKVTSTETITSKLRRVNFPNSDGSRGKDGYILRDKDIPEELTQNVRELLKDIDKLEGEDDTLMKMLEVEQRCDKRKQVMDKLKEKLGL